MSAFHLTVTEARESKTYTYQDAFAPIACEDCGQSDPIYLVECQYGSTTLLMTFVPFRCVAAAVAQGLELYDALRARIDAANVQFEQQDEAGQTETMNFPQTADN